MIDPDELRTRCVGRVNKDSRNSGVTLDVKEFICWTLLIIYSYVEYFETSDECKTDSAKMYDKDMSVTETSTFKWFFKCLNDFHNVRCQMLADILNLFVEPSAHYHQMLMKVSNSHNIMVHSSGYGFKLCDKCSLDHYSEIKFDTTSHVIIKMIKDKRSCFPSKLPFKYGPLIGPMNHQ